MSHIIFVHARRYVRLATKAVPRRPSVRCIASTTGMSLIEVLVAVGISGIVVVVVSAMMSNGFKSQRSLELASDITAIKTMLMQDINCSQTMQGVNPATCNGFIALRDSSGKVIVAGTAKGTAFGQWTIRASCAQNGITVGSARVGANSVFLNDPLTGKVQNWTNPKSSLFPPNAGPCQSYFSGQAGAKYLTVTNPTSFQFAPNSPPTNFCEILKPNANNSPWMVGSVQCPNGYTMITGGATCDHGLLAASGPGAPNGWSAACCPFPSFVNQALTKSIVFATCLRNDEFN